MREKGQIERGRRCVEGWEEGMEGCAWGSWGGGWGGGGESFDVFGGFACIVLGKWRVNIGFVGKEVCDGKRRL